MTDGKVTKKILCDILEKSGLPLVLLDEKKKVIYANGTFLEYFGKDQEDSIGKPIEYVISLDDEEKEMFDFSETGPPFDELLICCDSGGEKKEFYFSGQSFPLGHGKEGLLVIAREVTVRRRLERKLQESEQRYREMVNCSSDAIFLIEESSGKFLDVNKKALLLYEYDEEEFLGMTYDALLSAQEGPKAVLEQLRASFMDRENGFFEQVHKTGSGKEIFVEVTAAKISEREGQILVIARDITARKEMEKKLLKSEKFATLSTALSTLRHEINNPLTVIMGESQLLMIEKENLTEKALARVENIHKMGQRISSALTRLSQFVKSERGDIFEYAGIKMFRLNDEEE